MNYQAIAEAIRECGMRTGDFETINYSGRGMYGEECLAICCHSPFSVGVTLAKFAIRNNLQELLDFLQGYNPKTDSLGCDIVIYWPSLPALEQD